ncbi:MAG TPA: DUF3788 domain-containing protein [Candidatus Limnocylindrales bacterium]|nr:DUF3788 domain-containing protein [Candidatus Limnocylindrales bacterium]
MLPNAFTGKSHPPTDTELAGVLGSAKALWDRLLASLAAEHQLTTREWNSYSPKAGWSPRLKNKGRNIVYLGPCQGAFRTAFVLGDKAVAAARQSDLPPGVIKIINEAKRYAEGTAVRIEIKRAKDIETVTKLAGIKLAH